MINKTGPRLMRGPVFLVGVFRRGNKPPVEPGEENERSKKRKGELKASPKGKKLNLQV